MLVEIDRQVAGIMLSRSDPDSSNNYFIMMLIGSDLQLSERWRTNFWTCDGCEWRYSILLGYSNKIQWSSGQPSCLLEVAIITARVRAWREQLRSCTANRNSSRWRSHEAVAIPVCLISICLSVETIAPFWSRFGSINCFLLSEEKIL